MAQLNLILPTKEMLSIYMYKCLPSLQHSEPRKTTPDLITKISPFKFDQLLSVIWKYSPTSLPSLMIMLVLTLLCPVSGHQGYDPFRCTRTCTCVHVCIQMYCMYMYTHLHVHKACHRRN